jgi:hypothetical protein
MKKTFKKIVPLALIAIGLGLLVGCLYIPTGEIIETEPGHPKDMRKLVGAADPPQSLRLGQATRSHVIALLGRPDHHLDANHITYEWRSH